MLLKMVVTQTYLGEPMRLELNSAFPLKYVTELNVMGEQMSSVAVDKFSVVEKDV